MTFEDLKHESDELAELCVDYLSEYLGLNLNELLRNVRAKALQNKITETWE